MRTRAFFIVLCFFGCSTYTPQEQEEILSRLKIGVTTQADIDQQPSGVIHRDGYEIWLLPFESEEPGYGGATTRTGVVTLTWDENGVLYDLKSEALR